MRTAEYAAGRGAAMVSIIPARGGNGEMERLAKLGLFTRPTLRHLEMALEACLGWNGTVVTADLWNVEQLSACAACRDDRVARLARVNLTGKPETPVACSVCDT
jgi:hypothetical protein